MAYSVWLYIWLLVLAYFNAGHILFQLFAKNNDFLTQTFNALLLEAVVFCCCLPVLMWLDSPRYVQYFNQWDEFQVKYINITCLCNCLADDNNKAKLLVVYSLLWHTWEIVQGGSNMTGTICV
jgi:hypothetical protein